MKKIIHDKRATAMPLAVAIALGMLLIFCALSEYVRLLIIAQGVRDAVQSAIISTVNDNYDDVYHGVREGYSGAYQPMAGDFEESLDYGDVYERLDRILGLDRSSGYHVKWAGSNQTEFRISGLRIGIEIENVPIAPGGFDGPQFLADASIKLEVPVSFAGGLLPPMKMNVKTSAGYTPKF